MNSPPRLGRSDQNHYAHSSLDRASERRKDQNWVAEQFAAPNSVLVPVWRSRNLVKQQQDGTLPSAVLLPPSAYGGVLTQAGETVFLGFNDKGSYFAADFSSLDEAQANQLFNAGDNGIEFNDLRFIGPMVDREQGSLLAYARGMLTWHRRHLFCGLCGSPTESQEAGHLRACTDPECAQHHFPRTDPAVIMLVARGDKCLLGRQAAWPPNVYSTLAGFVEPGESLEAAVAREVFEESAIRVANVRYHSSQPWPFPTSLMLGFDAEALNDDIIVNKDELEDVRWFSRDWIKAKLAEGAEDFALPREVSIARQLINDWLAQE